MPPVGVASVNTVHRIQLTETIQFLPPTISQYLSTGSHISGLISRIGENKAFMGG